MKGKIFGTIAFVMVILALFAGLENNGAQAAVGMQVVESQLTLNSASQQNPDIYQYGLNNWAVVWQDNRNGNWDIYLYYQKYLGNSNWEVQWDSRITAGSGNNVNPKIYNDTIVYQSDRNGNWDIYIYNLTSKVETQITTDAASQQSPVIDGNTIVWQDNRQGHWRIYSYDLTTQVEKLAYDETWDVCDNYSPSIDGDLVVFISHVVIGTSEHYWVKSVNLLTGVSTIIDSRGNYTPPAHEEGSLAMPAICGNQIAYMESSSQYATRYPARWDVFMIDSSTGVTIEMTNNVYDGNPDMDEGPSRTFLVFERALPAGNTNLYLYDGETEYRTTNNIASQSRPQISAEYANFVVYMDNRNGNWDIYLSAFWYGTGAFETPHPPITPSNVLGQLEEVKSTILQLSTDDFAGANNKVKENRRNTIINQLNSAIADVQDAAYTQNLKMRTKCLQNAIDQLSDLTNKLDGWSLRGEADVAGSGHTPDWITAPAYLDQLIRTCQNNLQTLLQGTA